MARPDKPVVPPAPSRSRPGTFSDEAETLFRFLETFVDYLDNSSTFVQQEADEALAAAVTAHISQADLAREAGNALAVNAAGTGLTAASLSNIAIATQNEAEAGTNNAKAMTPLRTKQAFDEFIGDLVSRIKIRTRTANNSSAINFPSTDFDSSEYTDYEFVFDNILPASDRADLYLRPSDDNGTSSTSKRANKNFATWGTGNLIIGNDIGTAINETGFSGSLNIYDFHADKGAQFTLNAVYIDHNGAVQKQYVDSGMLQRPSVDGALNHIRLHMSSGNIRAGSVTLYGIK